ncbi:ddb37868-1c38-4ea1-a2e0-87cf722c488b [Sclerotinia trifoliorum]|uniref:5'-deoxynucleotidase n=1 Tax=Sclerotinia trifoliorum TaxID=28548 RepID=A0A8H2W4S3_9HELO|nr:ddb37868-1c38-4ea1-a2e0-87cf722c488b [Sclerotinia trifoliorum]
MSTTTNEANNKTATAAQQSWSVEDVVKAEFPVVPEENSESPVPFFHMLERLKTTKREGWRRFGIKRGESISDHMYRMSLITMFAPESLASKINIPHCTKMALVHDMAEALVGDITPVDGVPKSEKNRREATTMDYFTKNLLGRVNGGLAGQQIMDIWQEYEDSTTLESKFVHDVDKIELILQMVEYERSEEEGIDLGEFSWVATKIVLPEVQAWADEILKEREELWAGKNHLVYNGVKKPDEKKLAQTDEYYGGKENEIGKVEA